MKKNLLVLNGPSRVGKYLLAGALSAFALTSFAQDVVYLTAYQGSTVSPCPTLCSVSGSYSSFGSTAIASPPGVPSRTRCTYGYSQDFSWSIQPTLNVPGGIYKIEVAHTAATTSPDALVTATTSDGVLSDSCVNSPVFDAAHGGNSWQFLGYITNNAGVTQPTITFAVVGGAVGPASSQNRLYVDAFKFTEVNPCSGVAGDVSISGPLAEGQEFVKVIGIDAAATNITVYADGFEIGQLNSGIVAGTNTVPTTALFRGSEIKATQAKNGCASPLPGTGAIVGGGANPPQVNVFLSCWKNVDYTGPIGASAAPATTNYILKAIGLTQGSQSAPLGGEPVPADQCWHTVTFDHSIDAALYPNSGFDATGNTDPFCSLDALVFEINPDDPNSGPYDIYVDEIRNGDVVIENFEGVDAGTTNRFLAPNATATPSPNATYLPAPNSALVSQNNAFGGTNALRIQWQYADISTIRWTRVIANASTDKRYPQLDTTKPITIRYLILPVGESTNKLHFPTLPANQTKTTNETATFTVAAAGEGAFTYQWLYEGAPIDGATSSTYTKSNVQLSDAGTYSVVVTGGDGFGCSSTLDAELSVTEFVPPPTITYTWNGTSLELNWSGSFNLESTTDLTNPTWSNVGVTEGPYTVPLGSAATFYRLHNP